LIRNCATTEEAKVSTENGTRKIDPLLNVVTVHHVCIIRTILVRVKVINCLDVVDNNKDGARENKNEGDHTKSSNDVKADKGILKKVNILKRKKL